jgi:hypothetical protein
MERVDDARRLFERLLGLRNDLGQAFSHIALVNTAQNLSRVNKPAEHRSAP